MGNIWTLKDMRKFLKNLLLLNCWSDFEIISQKCSSVVSISRRQRVLRPEFEKKRWHFESRMVFLHPDFDKNVQEFPPRHLKKKCTKGWMCVNNFFTVNLT